MSKEQDPSRRPPEDYVRYKGGFEKADSSAIIQFAKDKPFVSGGIVIGPGIVAYRIANVRRRPQFLGKIQELNQYIIYTRLYVCGTVIAGATCEMANEFYK